MSGQVGQSVVVCRTVPTTIIQGRFDVVCPPSTAWELHRAFPEAEFVMVQDSGHSWKEPGTTAELLAATHKHNSFIESRMDMLSAADLAAYHRDGFVVVPGAIGSDSVASLLDAARDCAQSDAGVDQLLSPEQYRPAFGSLLAEELAPRIDPLVGGVGRLGSLALLGRSEPQGWHGGFPQAGLVRPGLGQEDESADAELHFLKAAAGMATEITVPLLAGECRLELVAGSHSRASTTDEAAALRGLSDDMPGASTLELQPGELLLLDPSLLRRQPAPDVACSGLHGTFWSKRNPVAAHEAGQRAALLARGHIARMPTAAARYAHRFCTAVPMEPPPLREIVLNGYPRVSGHTEDTPPQMLSAAQQNYYNT